MKELPRLTEDPLLHPDCCASLSSVLVKKLAQLIPLGSSLTISIGSGTGILEAFILREKPELNLQAIEVSHEVNQYLLEENLQVVLGTWDICRLASISAAWIFIYPRETSLVQNYLQNFGTSAVQLLIWLGPQADLSGMKGLMAGSAWKMEIVQDCGICEFEALVVWNKDYSST